MMNSSGKNSHEERMAELNIPGPKEQVIPSAANLFKALFLFSLLLSSFHAVHLIVKLLENNTAIHWFEWVIISAFAIFNGVLMLGMGALAHDAVHKVLFRSLFWNEFWGGLLSAMTLIPFHANRQFHLSHHSYAHQPGLDPENEMHHHSFNVAAAIGPFIGLYVQYRIFMLNALRARTWRMLSRTFKDIISVAAAGAIYFALVPAMGLSLSTTVIPMLLLFPAVFTWRALSDHYGIPATVRTAQKREELTESDGEAWHQERLRQRQEVSGWVVITHPWLEWLWSHVNYHEVHHKYPYLSHQYLPQVFKATRNRYPYLVVQGYWKSMFNLRQRKYYAEPADVQQFLAQADS